MRMNASQIAPGNNVLAFCPLGNGATEILLTRIESTQDAENRYKKGDARRNRFIQMIALLSRYIDFVVPSLVGFNFAGHSICGNQR